MNMKIYKNYAIRVNSLNQIKLYIDVRFPSIICWKYSNIRRDGHDFDFKIKIMILKSKSWFDFDFKSPYI